MVGLKWCLAGKMFTPVSVIVKHISMFLCANWRKNSKVPLRLSGLSLVLQVIGLKLNPNAPHKRWYCKFLQTVGSNLNSNLWQQQKLPGYAEEKITFWLNIPPQTRLEILPRSPENYSMVSPLQMLKLLQLRLQSFTITPSSSWYEVRS